MDGQATQYLNEIVALIDEKNPRHSKKVKKNIQAFDEQGLKRITPFIEKYIAYINKEGLTLEYSVDCYLKMIEDMMYEQIEFLKSGEYSCKSFADAYERVYNNPQEMSTYMQGLLLSQFLWLHHYQILQHFEGVLKERSNQVKNYLEVGGGHGLYMQAALDILKNGEQFHLIDISQSSIDLAKHFISSDKVKYILMDVTRYQSDVKYDFITIGEVLEHLEDPKSFLESIKGMLSDNGVVYITVPANAPAIDHIYLFNSMSHIESLVADAGFKVITKAYFPAEDISVERAEKIRSSVLFAGLIQRND